MIRRAAGAAPPSSPTSGTLVATVAAPGTSYKNTGLSASKTYSYALFAYDSTPSYSAPADLTVTTAPAPVTSLTVTGTTSSSVSLSWVNPTGSNFAGVMIRRAVGTTPPDRKSVG